MKPTSVLGRGLLCLLLLMAGSLCHANTATLPQDDQGELVAPGDQDQKLDEYTPESPAYTDSLLQSDPATDEEAAQEPEKHLFQIPIPSSIWLMAFGLIALVVIRRRYKR